MDGRIEMWIDGLRMDDPGGRISRWKDGRLRSRCAMDGWMGRMIISHFDIWTDE